MLPGEESEAAGNLVLGLAPGGASPPLQAGSESIETCWLGLRLYEGAVEECRVRLVGFGVHVDKGVCVTSAGLEERCD
jgi:hypothetical protein